MAHSQYRIVSSHMKNKTSIEQEIVVPRNLQESTSLTSRPLIVRFWFHSEKQPSIMVCVEPETVNMGNRGPNRLRNLNKYFEPQIDHEAVSLLSEPHTFRYVLPSLQLTLNAQSLEELVVPREGNKKHKANRCVSLSSPQTPNKVSGMTDRKASTKHCKSSIPVAAVLIAVMLILHVTTTCHAFEEYKVTKQDLSPECMDLLQLDYPGQCPDQNHIAALDLARLQSLCCHDSVTLKFHCQANDKDDGTVVLFPACLEEIIIENGKFRKLTVDKNDVPKLEQHTCQTGYFELKNRSSTREIYPFCRNSHTSCKEDKGEIAFCLGDAASDTMCVCADGYTPSSADCSKPFTQHSGCSCRQNEEARYCHSAGQLPVCSHLSDDEFIVSTTCPKLEAPPSTPATSTHSPPNTLAPTTCDSITSSSTATDAPTDIESDHWGFKWWYLVVVVVVILLVLVLVVIFLFRSNIMSWYVRKRKNCWRRLQNIHRQHLEQDDPEQGESSLDSGSSSGDLLDNDQTS